MTYRKNQLFALAASAFLCLSPVQAVCAQDQPANAEQSEEQQARKIYVGAKSAVIGGVAFTLSCTLTESNRVWSSQSTIIRSNGQIQLVSHSPLPASSSVRNVVKIGGVNYTVDVYCS